MNKQIVDVELARERASATPAGAAQARPRSRLAVVEAVAATSPASTAAPVEPAGPAAGLRREQLWFAGAVMTPESSPPAVTADQASRLLTAGPRLGALDRLEVYRRAYHARLVECLADDYPVLQHALGEGPFEDLCRAYVARHPSEGPNLNFFGGKMAAFCRDEASLPLSLRAFATDLASLEWAIVEVIHAPSSPPLTMEGLGDVPMEAWPKARLAPNSALRLLRSDYPVNAYFQAVRDRVRTPERSEGSDPERDRPRTPERSEGSDPSLTAGGDPPIPGAAPSSTVVYRSGPTVWRMDLTEAMVAVLSALVGGETLEASLSRAEPSLGGIDEEEAARRVLAWFREWVASGLFVRVEIDR